MASFKDSKGRAWELPITHADVLRVKSVCGVNIYQFLEKEMAALRDLLGDPEKLVQVVFCLIEPAAVASGVEPEDFGKALDGPALEAMAEAFYQAVADFFPNRGAREALRKMIPKGKRAAEIMLERNLAALDSLSPERLADWDQARNQGASKEELRAILGSLPTTSSAPSSSLPGKSA